MLGVAVVGLFVVILGVVRISRSPERFVAYPAPAFDLPELARPSERVHLGRGPLLLNFFDSTCVTCIAEMPALQALADEGRVRVIGIDLLDRRDAALRLVKQTGVRYPIGFDQQGDTIDDYHALRLPTTLAINAQGQVVGSTFRALTKSSARRFAAKAR